VHAIGRQIVSPGFAEEMFDASMCYIDKDKMFMCGHSLGGWTSMLATFGD